MLKEGNELGALQKEPIIAPFKEWFKIVSLRKTKSSISLVLTVICLNIDINHFDINHFKISIFEISNMPNVNKFQAISILELIWA